MGFRAWSLLRRVLYAFLFESYNGLRSMLQSFGGAGRRVL